MNFKFKKIVLTVCVLFITHGICAFSTGKYFFLKKDISLVQPINPEYKTKNWVIGFAKGGVYEAGQNFNAQNSVNKGFDVIINYKKRDIDNDFYQKNKDILDQKRGVGYWLWKPYFILKTLNMMNEGDVLMYLDAGVIFLSNIYPYIDKMVKNDKDIILFKNGHTNRIYNKKDAFMLMGVDEKYQDYPQMAGGLMIIRNTKRARDFIQKWMTYCQDKRILTDQKSINGEFSDFKDHRHDQAVLSLLYYKEPAGVLIADDDKDFLIHQRRDINISLAWLMLKHRILKYFN